MIIWGLKRMYWDTNNKNVGLWSSQSHEQKKDKKEK